MTLHEFLTLGTAEDSGFQILDRDDAAVVPVWEAHLDPQDPRRQTQKWAKLQMRRLGAESLVVHPDTFVALMELPGWSQGFDPVEESGTGYGYRGATSSKIDLYVDQVSEPDAVRTWGRRRVDVDVFRFVGRAWAAKVLDRLR